MAVISLITTIQVNLCVFFKCHLEFVTNFTWIVVIKIFAIHLSSQPFLNPHLEFHIFFTTAFLEAANFLKAGLFWLVYTHFYNFICHTVKLESNIRIAQLQKSVQAPKKAIVNKRCKIQGGGQEMALVVG